MADAASTNDAVAAYNPLTTRFPQETQYGRLRHFLDLSDPRTLAPGFFFGMSLEKATHLLDGHALASKGDAPQPPTTTLPPLAPTNTELWLARKIHSAAIHPDTGEVIPQPFRMSGFAVYGSFIVSGMLLPNPAGNILQTVFWQSLNQTHNAAVNYANRNATAGTNFDSLAKGYVGAVTASVSIAVGLGQLVKRSALQTATKVMVSRFMAYPAVATANLANLLMMRWPEVEQGVELKEVGTDQVHGMSKIAAKSALFDTAITRVVLPMPMLLFTPMIITQLVKLPALKRSPRMQMVAEGLVCVGAFVVALPCVLSLFSQEQVVAVTELEPEFQSLRDGEGKLLTHLRYNKGL